MTFRTNDGIEVPSVTADQMREVDRINEFFDHIERRHPSF